MKERKWPVSRLRLSSYLLNNNDQAAWWNEIYVSALKDAASNSSDYYFQRVKDHCEWDLLNLKGAVGAGYWSQIDAAATRDLANWGH